MVQIPPEIAAIIEAQVRAEAPKSASLVIVEHLRRALFTHQHSADEVRMWKGDSYVLTLAARQLLEAMTLAGDEQLAAYERAVLLVITQALRVTPPVTRQTPPA